MRHIIDQFLPGFDGFRSHCDILDYAGQVNPMDGVMYPGITTDIPDYVHDSVIAGMQHIIGRKLKDILMFLRITVDGEAVPHEAHNDAVMGDYGLLLYMNRHEHCKGGTAFVTHIETGMDTNPKDLEQEAIWRRDTNVTDAWEITEMVNMAPNRAILFDTQDMHRAEFPTSFGHTPHDGRLLLTCFARAA